MFRLKNPLRIFIGKYSFLLFFFISTLSFISFFFIDETFQSMSVTQFYRFYARFVLVLHESYHWTLHYYNPNKLRKPNKKLFFVCEMSWPTMGYLCLSSLRLFMELSFPLLRTNLLLPVFTLFHIPAKWHCNRGDKQNMASLYAQ